MHEPSVELCVVKFLKKKHYTGEVPFVAFKQEVSTSISCLQISDNQVPNNRINILHLL